MFGFSSSRRDLEGSMSSGDTDCVTGLVLYNPTDHPIEVYSVDFDKVYLEEEFMLKEFDKYDPYGNPQMSIPSPGDPTWADVVKNSEVLRRQREGAQRQAEKDQRRQLAVENGEGFEEQEEEEEAEEQEQENVESDGPKVRV